jgi:cell volume regulation protein A
MGKVSGKTGIPMLLIFMLLGMLFGEDGPFGIRFEDFSFSEQISTVCLVFIMFYGGFGTNWKEGKKVAVKAGLLSSIGTILTAGLTGLFCYFVLGITLLEGLLIGSVIASTDAATVFFILRSKKLNLKSGTAPLLELESGSNDPWSYMLTIIVLELMQTSGGAGIEAAAFVELILKQVLIGAALGAAIAYISTLMFKNVELTGISSVLMVGIALIGYAAPSLLGGNGYLSVYIIGIVLGNIQIAEKRTLVHFFDGVTGFLQIVLFFLLGFLATPTEIPSVLGVAVLIMLFLTFVARPIAVTAVLAPFKTSLRQLSVMWFAGFRGAASIAFAILIHISVVQTQYDVFHLTFVIVLLSIATQGALLPWFAKKVGMISETEDVMKTFSDYSNETELQFIATTISASHPWVGKKFRKLEFPPDIRAVMIKRGIERVIPKGNTEILEDDIIILVGNGYIGSGDIDLTEIIIDKDNEACGKHISELGIPANELIVLIKRQTKNGVTTIVPTGKIFIHEGDVLVLASEG